jgi:protein-glutamine gamma-glutamyltransferase
MSIAQVAVLPGRVGSRAWAGPAVGERDERPGVRILAFLLLGLYGVHRWATLLAGPTTARLAGMLACATLLAVVGPPLARRHRLLALPLALFLAAATLVAAGLPVSWILHLRISASASVIGEGLSALAGVVLPYGGVNEWIRMTILLGAAVLLLDAAVVLTFVPAHRGLVRRAGAALPLLALAVIPTTLLRPQLPYLEGVLVFALLVLFMWGERIRSRRLGAVAVPCLLVVSAALILAPGLDRHRPWIDYRALATGLAPGGVETFDWAQGYGPLSWPHTGRTVAEIQAVHPDYWKVADLDEFNGSGWATAIDPPEVPWKIGISSRSLRRWTQSLQVTLRLMRTSKVIAAGSAYRPARLSGSVVPGADTGSWQTATRMGPGDAYRVRVYAPHPSAARLRSAGISYPAQITSAYLSMLVPEPGSLSGPSLGSSAEPVPQSNITFPSFATGRAAAAGGSEEIVSTMRASPYARAYALARRLADGAPSPYAYAQRIERYLRHGYAYSLHVRATRYPLMTFLFSSRRGYCQHFAGAMALLLRMGGVPARVAVGFTPGSYDNATHHWLVTDKDAHAWVEAWFPHYGWIRFDPTPSADPALANLRHQSTGPVGGNTHSLPAAPRHREQGLAPAASTSHSSHRRPQTGTGSATWLIVLAVLAALLLAATVLTRARPGQDPVAELVRAYARSGRPLSQSATLAGLERRLGPDWPQAAAYVRGLRLARFAPGRHGHSLRQRRALRAALGEGLGLTGKARAWWALPPRWGASGRP